MSATETLVQEGAAGTAATAKTKGLGAATGPIVGFVSCALGTGVATVLFPADPSPRGALVIPGIVLSLAIAFVPAMRWLSAAKSRMNAENFVAIGYIFWLLLDLIQGAYELRDASDEALKLAFIAIGVSASVMWLGVMGKPWALPKGLYEMAKTRLESKLVGRLIAICFFLGMFNFAYSVNFDIPEMFSYLGAQRWAVPWGRAQLGGWSSFADQLPYFGYVLPSLTAILLVRQGFKFQTWMAISASTIMVLFLAQSGGRRIIGVTVGSAIIVWAQSQPRLNLRRLAMIGAALIGLLWGMQFMLNIRTTGYADYMSTASSDYDYLHVDDNFLRLAQVIQLVPARHDYVYLQQIVFTLIRPVPRVFWPNKPINAGFDLPSEMGMKGVSLSTSIIGEWYLSFGWLALLFGAWFHGRLAASANSLRDYGREENPIVFALLVMVLVSGMRSMQDLVIMSYALVAFWGASRLTRPAKYRVLKLLHVVASYLPATRYGGTIVSVHGLCRALAARGHEVHVYTTSVDGAANSPVPHGVPVTLDGVNVWYFESKHLRRIYRSPPLGAALRQHVRDFHVVHTHAIYLWPLWTAAREAHRAGVPYVVSPRGMLEKELIEQKSALMKASLIGFVEKQTLEGAAAVHVTSRREADEAASFGFQLRTVREIPNGVDIETPSGQAVSPAIAAIINDGPFVLFVGRINWKKGLDRLVAALPHAPGVRMVIAGNDEDGYQRVIESLAAATGVAPQMVFAGPVGSVDKLALMTAARGLVLPSYSENFGNVVLEAMAAGRPVLVTPEVGIADLVRSSGAGLVVDGAPERLGSAIEKLAADIADGDRMGERGRVTASRYSWDSVAAMMERLYEDVQP